MNFFVIRLIIGLVLSFLITLYLIPYFLNIARKRSFVDSPDGIIKKQEKSVPYLGGLAIFTGFITTAVLIVPGASTIFLLLPCLTMLLLLGLIDDLVVLKPYQKFFGQFIATLCFLKSSLYVKSSFFCNYYYLFISGLWMISIINAFNLIDVMDGLASTVAIGVSFIFLIISLGLKLGDVSLFVVCLIGPLLAFFLYNRPPAMMYLGDAGSLFLGGFFATLPFLFPWGLYNSNGFLTPLIILFVPLLELLWLVLIRTWHKIPFYKASPHHFAFIFLTRNWSKNSILLLTSLITIQAGIIGWLFFVNYIDPIMLFVGLAYIAIFLLVALICL